MKRHELEHVIRAAGAITGADTVVVIGSQAILGQLPDAPDVLLRSCEADVYTLRNSADADLIDGSIGEGSPFHETFGYYAQGVAEETAILPKGWKERLVRICNDNTRHVSGLCLEVHDLAVSKLAAGREKDRDFVSALHAHGLVDAERIRERIFQLSVSQEEQQRIWERWQRLVC